MAANAVDGAVVIGVDADTQGFDSAINSLGDDAAKSIEEVFEALKQVDEQLDVLSKAYENTSREAQTNFESGADNTDTYARALDILSRTIETTEAKLYEMQNAQETVNSAFENHQIDYEQYTAFYAELANVSSEFERLKQTYDEFEQGGESTYIDSITEELNGLSDGADKAGESTINLGDLIKANLTSSAVQAAVKELLSLIKELQQEIVNIVVQSGEMGNVIDKQSQKLGMTEEAYQEWSYILSQNGADISTLTVGMRTLTNQIDGLKNGSKNATQAFNQLGLSISDLQGLTGEEQFSLVIERLQGIEDETQRNAIANDVLGRSYMQLIPLLNQSADSVEALRQRAHDTNQLMSSEGIQAAVEYTDAMDTLSRSFEGFKNNIGAEILPGITEVTNGITDLINGVDGAEETIMNGVEKTVSGVEAVLPRIGTFFNTIIKTAAKRSPQIIEKISQSIKEHLPEILDAFSDLADTVNTAIINALPSIGEGATNIVLTIFGNILQTLSDPEQVLKLFVAFGELGYNLCSGIADGIMQYDWENLSYNVMNKLAGVLDEARKTVQVGIDKLVSGVTTGNWEGDLYGGDKNKVGSNSLYGYLQSDKYKQDLDKMWSDIRTNYEDGQKTINEWRDSVKDFVGIVTEPAADAAEQTEETVEKVEEASRAYTQAITTAAEDEEDKLNEVLQKKLDTLDHAYKTHKISEVAYWAKRKELLEQYRDEDNTAWWEVYDDVLDHYNALAETIKKGIENTFSTLKSKTDEAEKKFKASSETIINSVKEEATNGIKGLKSSFTELLNVYQKGYNDILTQRNSYKQKLMGGSIFEVLQKTDEETGEQYTQYTIHNLSERLRTRTAYAQQMAKLEERNLAKGLQQELEGLDAETGLVFAKQLNAMSDEEFDQLNAAYNKLDEETTKLANEKYQGALDDLQDNFIGACTALFKGMDADLTALGADGAQKFIDAFQKGFENDGKAVSESITTFLDELSQSVTNGTADLSTLIADSLQEQGYEIGSSLVDQMISAVNDKKTDFEQALTDLFDVTGLDTRIISDVESRSARYSEGGYRAATYIADSATDSSGAKANSSTQTITANLKLLDGTGRVLAEIVNAENQRLQIGAGT